MTTWLPSARALRDDLEPLWVGGLALAQVYLAYRWLPLHGEPYEWAQYLLLGVVLPLRWYQIALRRLVTRGAGFTDIIVPGLALLAIFIGLLAVIRWRLKPRLA